MESIRSYNAAVVFVAFTMLAVALAAAPADSFVLRPAADVSNAAAWSVNPDGGDGIVFEVTAGPALRVQYTRGVKGWGNVMTAAALPPETVGVKLRVRFSAAEPKAGFYVWLFEKDGDAHLANVRPQGKPIHDAGPAWLDVFLPLNTFLFDGRGDRTRAMQAVNRLLLGCSHGSLRAEVASIEYLLMRKQPAAARDVQPSDGDGPCIALLDTNGLPREGAPADPKRLKALLTEGAFQVDVLSANELAVRKLDAYDLLILPTGPVFPTTCRHRVLAYLKGGGSLLTTGGYAFDNPVLPVGGGTFVTCATCVTAAELDAQPAEGYPINTRSGRPGDTLRLKPDQIGMFDPGDRFEEAVKIRGGAYDLAGTFSGWSAVGLIGTNSPVFPTVLSRWQPLLFATDRYDRVVGPAAGLLSHFGGPFRGGRWAFFGVENVDLFGEDNLPATYVVKLARTLVARCFAWELLPRYECYRPGEAVDMTVNVGNFGRREQTVLLTVTAPKTPDQKRELTLAGGEEKIERFSFTAPKAFGLYSIRARLSMSPVENFLAEEDLTAGFCVWDPAAGVEGPTLTYNRNRFVVENRPVFLTGTNQTGVVWFSSHEEPGLWARDFTRLRDHGLNVVRYLHFSPFATENPMGAAGQDRNDPMNLAKEPPERLIRSTDALMYLLVRHRQIPFLTLHDWQPVELTAAQLDAQKRWARFWTSRYRGLKGKLYDIQNEPTVRVQSTPTQQKLWTEYLGTLPEAVGVAFPDPTVVLDASDLSWSDPRGTLQQRFKIWLFRRWTGAHWEGVREGDPEALLTVGLLPTNPPIDKALGPKGMSFSCFHFYGRLEDFAVEARWADRRCAGQGLTIGEFGAQEAHNARTRGESGEFAAESVRRYFFTNLVTLGLGGAMTCSWDMKEMPETVFPWGMAHRDGRPKTVLRAYRAITLFFRSFVARPPDPKVAILLPDGNRIGAGKGTIDRAIASTILTFLHLNVPFCLATEEDLLSGKLTANLGRVRLWPLPHVANPEACTRIYEELNAGAAHTFGPLTEWMRFTVPTETGRVAIAANPRDQDHEVSLGPDLTLSLPAKSVCAVHVRSDGAILGIVGQGKVFNKDGKPLVHLPAPSVLFSPFGEDITKSAVLVLSAFEPGSFAAYWLRDDFKALAVGEIVDGTFVVYERGELRPALFTSGSTSSNGTSVSIDRERRGSLILLGREDRFEEAGKLLADRTQLRF